MMNPEIFSLWIIGAVAIFGLQGSLAMAMRHHLFRNQLGRSKCDRLLGSPHAFIGPIPVALFAALYYVLILYLLFDIFLSGENTIDQMPPLILISLPITAYYAWLLFLKLRVRCMGCIRIQIYNLIIGASYLNIILNC
jgi:uncharacterized membrane protein